MILQFFLIDSFSKLAFIKETQYLLDTTRDEEMLYLEVIGHVIAVYFIKMARCLPTSSPVPPSKRQAEL